MFKSLVRCCAIIYSPKHLKNLSTGRTRDTLDKIADLFNEVFALFFSNAALLIMAQISTNIYYLLLLLLGGRGVVWSE